MIKIPPHQHYPSPAIASQQHAYYAGSDILSRHNLILALTCTRIHERLLVQHVTGIYHRSRSVYATWYRYVPTQQTSYVSYIEVMLTLCNVLHTKQTTRNHLPAYDTKQCGGSVSFWYGSGSRMWKNSLRIRIQGELWYGSGSWQKRYGSGSSKKGLCTRKFFKMW